MRRWVLVMAMVGTSASATAQPVQVVTLGAPEWRSAHEFSEAFSARELKSGELLVTDRREREFFMISADGKGIRGIGRAGDGPGEYRVPGWLMALGGDSTVLTDLQSGRWLIYAGATFVRALTRADPAVSRLRALPGGADNQGRALAFVGINRPGTQRMYGTEFPSVADTVGFVLVDRRTGRPDTVARGVGGYVGPSNDVRRTSGGQVIVHILNGALVTHDQAILFPDGALAVVTVAPYGVRWLTRDARGRFASGPWRRLPDEEIRVNDAEKAFAMRKYWRSDYTVEEMPHWPARLPPFLERALLPGPDGSVLVARTTSANHPEPRYDVVDRTGRLVRQLQLPANSRVVATGVRSLYVVRVDEDGIERLERHGWR